MLWAMFPPALSPAKNTAPRSAWSFSRVEGGADAEGAAVDVDEEGELAAFVGGGGR
ncbi:hypothetical protein Fmac_006126 [Flemingia macrophylla]|uniref:Uncharacterized protein n=1 Tax=Flemingia macrophylla TaxID=520843 RepID=A0ABD1N9Q6_9FABA